MNAKKRKSRRLDLQPRIPRTWKLIDHIAKASFKARITDLAYLTQYSQEGLELLRVNGPGVGLGPKMDARALPGRLCRSHRRVNRRQCPGSRDHGHATQKLAPRPVEMCSQCWHAMHQVVPPRLIVNCRGL